MEITTDLKIGQLVKSKAGRDKGKLFIIYEILDEQFLLVCDGDLRKIEKPKKKKVKHLMIYNTVFTEFADKLQSSGNLNDAYVRELFQKAAGASNEMEVE